MSVIKKLILFLTDFLALIFLVILFLPETIKRNIVIVDHSQVKAEFLVELADSPEKRFRGLSGRPGLGENEGMLFIFDSPGRYGFVMRNMKFSLDIIWIAKGEVVGFQKRLPISDLSDTEPSIYYPPMPVDQVLEVNAGTVDKYNIEIGDKIRWK